MKITWLRHLCLLLVIVVFGIVPGYTQTLSPKLATSLTTDTVTWQTLQFWQEELARMSQDQFTVQMFPESQLGSENDVLHGVRFGHIEIALLSVDTLLSLSPSFAAIAMPYIFRDDTHRSNVLDGPPGKRLLAGLSQYLVIGLGFLDAEPQGVFSFQTPLTTPTTFQDVTIGSAVGHCEAHTEDPQEKFILAKAVDSLMVLGAHHIPLCLEHQKEALASGEITAWKGPLDDWNRLAAIGSKSSAFTFIPHLEHPYALVVSKRWFESLSPEEQAMLHKASRLATLYQRQLLNAFVQDQTTLLQNAGIQVEAVNANSFYEVVQPAYARITAVLGEEFEATLQEIERVK